MEPLHLEQAGGMIRHFLSNVAFVAKDGWQHWNARAVLPRPVDHADLFVVDFPRSGVTWLSFLLTNALLLHSGDERSLNFFNIEDFIPDIHSRNRISPSIIPGVGHRIFKSHSGFTPCYRKLFYLVRDPRHVMVSYHRFLTELHLFSGSIEEMVADKRLGIEAWCRHVGGWLDGVAPSTAMTLVRYEDLLADPGAELRQLVAFLGWEPKDALIDIALRRSSIEAMRQAEAVFNARHPALRDFAFVRKGNVGGGRGPLSPALARQITDRAGPLLERLGYPV